MGADYWRTLTIEEVEGVLPCEYVANARPDQHNCPVGHGRFKYVTNDWQSFNMISWYEEILDNQETLAYPPPLEDHPYADVTPDQWAVCHIKAIKTGKITGGCGNGNYCPQGLVTREQMAAFLIRAIEDDPDVDYCNGVDPFLDVASGAWSCPHIKRLGELNITGGCGGGKYCPQGLVTREQMAVFIVRALEGNPAANYCNGVAPFNDVSAASWSCGHIKRLVELGVTQGCGNGNYCPGNEVTREQMAAFLDRAFLDTE